MGKGDNVQGEAVASRPKKGRKGTKEKEILFSKENYIIIGVGLIIVIIGLFLMSGGYNEPDQWDANEIYSFTRITLAPIVILGGLGVVIFAIFKSSDKEEVQGLEA